MARTIPVSATYRTVRRALTDRTFRLLEDVPHAAHGVDESRFALLLELLPQEVDEDVHDVRLPLEAVVPDVLRDGRAGEHPLGIPEEVLEEGILLRGELDLAVLAEHPAVDEVHGHLAELEDGRGAGLSPPEEGADAGPQ